MPDPSANPTKPLGAGAALMPSWRFTSSIPSEPYGLLGSLSQIRATAAAMQAGFGQQPWDLGKGFIGDQSLPNVPGADLSQLNALARALRMPSLTPETPQQQRMGFITEAAAQPETQAMLDLLGHAEDANYNTLFGGKTFSDYSKHPSAGLQGVLNTSAGRYQMKLATWKDEGARLGLSDYYPLTQDSMAIDLMLRKNALGPLQAGDLRGGIAPLVRTWTSLPGRR